jgi:hypothetical protein
MCLLMMRNIYFLFDYLIKLKFNLDVVPVYLEISRLELLSSRSYSNHTWRFFYFKNLLLSDFFRGHVIILII